MKSSVSDSFVPYPDSDTAWIRSVSGRIANAADSLFGVANPEVVTINASKSDSAYFSGGTRIYTNPGFCQYSNGSNAEGEVKVSFLQLKKRGDFIRYGKPAMSGSKLLNQIAALRVIITKEGNILNISQRSEFNIRFEGVAPDEQQSIFSGDTTRYNRANFLWDVTADYASPFEELLNQQVRKSYSFLCRKTGWIGLGREIGSSNTTKLTAVAPVIFTNANTAVFAIFLNHSTVVRLTPDAGSRTFYATGIPAGTPLQLLSISRISNNKLYVGLDATIVEKNGAIVKLKPEETSLNELNNLLDRL
ncbi:hypothetical protein [Filimonas effusa]|uniref:Uncharacterized protein n=1 Tax=Filimonas effusa TaxID=2508721 RepID=A0A4Q1CZ04_9BACT|nr:hypothetical protein [Filimonas effusa]RXK80585.1 hypothetical protein ESB13_23410 [Filimonas effusa]